MAEWRKDIVHSCYGCPCIITTLAIRTGRTINIVAATITNAIISVMVAILMLECMRKKAKKVAVMNNKRCMFCVYLTKIPRHSVFWCCRYPRLERVEYPEDQWCGEFKGCEEVSK